MTQNIFSHPAAPNLSVPILEMRNISKSFGPVQALKKLSFRVDRNEVVGLIGENGAGKSTLLKVLGGAYSLDSGEFLLNGMPVTLRTPSDAVEKGIGMVYQEQSLLLNLTVAENIHNGLPVSQRRKAQRLGIYRWDLVNARARRALALVNAGMIDPMSIAGQLSFAERQMVEIAKAVAVGESEGRTPLVVLDEATSILERAEIDTLALEVARLKTLGSVIFVSHRMSEILEMSDRIYVMREGEVVAERLARETNEKELIELMTGRTVSVANRRAGQVASTKPRLQISNLSLAKTYSGINLDVMAGQVVAIAGTNGSGREALMRTVFGILPADSGAISLDGEPFVGSPVQSVRAGIGYLPAERRVEGMIPGISVADNLCLTHPGKSARGPFRFPSKRVEIAQDWIKRLSVRPANPFADIARLSGGNQQKIVLAKWLSAPNLRLLLLDHPLRGLDPGARDQVMDLIEGACSDGIGVLLLADTIEEALEVGDQVIVMRDGLISGLFNLHERVPSVPELLEKMV